MIGKLPDFVRKWIWGPVAMLLAVGPLCVSQVLQMLTIVVLPISRPAFRWLNTRIAGGVWGFWAWTVQNIDGTKITITGDDVPDRENAIVIANHQEMGDVVVLMSLALKKHRVGNLKWLVKDVVKYVPGVGWGMLFLDCVFLKRNWMKDANTIKRVFSRINDNKLPVWLVSFPEGTRAIPEKLKKGQHKDKTRGLEPYKHLLRPKYKGFAASVAGLESHVKAIYSVTIFYHGKVPSLTGLIRGDSREITLNVRRFPLTALPKDEKGLEAWLLEEYRHKDQFLASLHASG